MQENQLQVILTEQNVAKENSKQLLEAFGAPFEEAGKILADYQLIEVTEEDQFGLMAEARSKRLALKNIRVGVENKRKELKENSLRTGRAIDSVAKFVKEIIEPAEKYLESQEKFAEIRAAERQRLMVEVRGAILQKLVDMPALYKFEDLADEDFDKLVDELKAQKFQREEAARLAKEEEEKAAEQERQRQAAIVAENAKLKAAAEAREAEIAKQRAADEERLAAERVEQEKKLAAERAAAEEERKKREALEASQRAQREKAAADQQRAEDEKRQALLAPDKEKLLALATTIEELQLPALASKDAQAVLSQVEGLLSKVTAYIRGNVKGL